MRIQSKYNRLTVAMAGVFILAVIFWALVLVKQTTAVLDQLKRDHHAHSQ